MTGRRSCHEFGGWLLAKRRLNDITCSSSRATDPTVARASWAAEAGLVAGLVIPYLVVRDVRRASGHTPQLAPVGWWWASLLVAVVLNRLVWLYHTVTSDGGTFEETWLDTRTAAYPLWITGTVMIVVTVFLSVRVVRLITEAQRQTARHAIRRHCG